MKTSKQLSRRSFLKKSALAGSGLLLSFTVPVRTTRQQAPVSAPSAVAPNAFLHIGEDDSIQIILTKVEMGQGIWTTLPMLIAEELDCDISKINVKHSPAGKEYADPVWGQSTGGSTSTTSEFDRYRQVGATARAMLVEVAAKRLGLQPTDCMTENGFIIAGNRRLRYGEVADEASRLPVPTVKLRDAKEWKYVGKSQKRLDNPSKINGKATYGLDIQFPGLLTAVVAHPPVFGAIVRSFDATDAEAIHGVKEVIQIPSGVAVIADHFWNAKRGRDVLKIEWDLGPHAIINSEDLRKEYKNLSRTSGIKAQHKGDVEKALKTASKTIEADFSVPYLAHAPMEPLNCTVKIENNRCELWVGNQTPMLFQSIVAELLGFKPEQVIVNTPCIGGSFGRKASFDADWVVEAVHIAKASGKFIKLVWSREDDIRGGYYRPACFHHVVVGIGNDGLPIAWRHRIVGQSIFKNTVLEKLIVASGVDYSTIDGVNGSPYFNTISDHAVELHTTSVGVPVLSWRSVGNSHTAFVMEVLIDELATIAGEDPVAYRRKLLKGSMRHLAALDLAAEKAAWGKPLPTGRFRGVAVHAAMGSYVAQVVEVSVQNKKIRVHRVVCAIDCGLAVNPDGVKSQIEGGIVFGLTAALYGEITLENGKVKQSNFNDYRMLRISETPMIEVHIVNSTEPMGGAGEPGVPPIAPALANALFAATGRRVRSLPLRLDS